MNSLNFPHEISVHTAVFIELIVRIVNTTEYIFFDYSNWAEMIFFAAMILPGAIIGTFIIIPLTKGHYRTTIMLGATSLLLAIA